MNRLPARSEKYSASEASGSQSVVTPRAKREGRTPSSPDRFRLVSLALDYTRLSRPKPSREPVRRLAGIEPRPLNWWEASALTTAPSLLPSTPEHNKPRLHVAAPVNLICLFTYTCFRLSSAPKRNKPKQSYRLSKS